MEFNHTLLRHDIGLQDDMHLMKRNVQFVDGMARPRGGGSRTLGRVWGIKVPNARG